MNSDKVAKVAAGRPEAGAPARASSLRRRACASLLAGFALAAAHAADGGNATDASAATPRARDGAVIYVPHGYFGGPCVAYGACAADWWWGWWVRRTPPRRPVAPDPPQAVDPDIWGTTGSPWGYVRRLPPPTPEDQIQPRYRESSQVRPEFAESGTAAPR